MQKIRDILVPRYTPISFEFFPPKKKEGWDRVFEVIDRLRSLNPAYVSVTYGAGGSTRENTHRLIARLRQETDLSIVAHLTCVNSSKEEVEDILRRYRDIGVNNILALRGDMPDTEADPAELYREFPHAADLVRFIKDNFPDMGIGVAGFPEGHPLMPNRLKEIDYLKEKVDAGADYIVTQLFFDNRDFYDFCERCEIAGIRVPIIAGIMPITSRKGMERMAELAAGARFPASLLRRVLQASDKKEVEEIGVDWATGQVEDLIAHRVAGIHLYTLNHSSASIRIFKNLEGRWAGL